MELHLQQLWLLVLRLVLLPMIRCCASAQLCFEMCTPVARGVPPFPRRPSSGSHQVLGRWKIQEEVWVLPVDASPNEMGAYLQVVRPYSMVPVSACVDIRKGGTNRVSRLHTFSASRCRAACCVHKPIIALRPGLVNLARFSVTPTPRDILHTHGAMQNQISRVSVCPAVCGARRTACRETDGSAH